MIQAATISVECDNCGDSVSYELTKLAAPGEWDQRNLMKQMEKDGWTVYGDKTYCDACDIQEEDET